MKTLFIIAIAAMAMLGSISITNAQSLSNEITIAGTVTLKSGNVLIVRNGAVDTRVIVDQYSRFIDRNGLAISYSDIELGDRIQAFGELTGVRTLYADTIRNVVIPAGGFEQIVTGTVSSKLGGSMLVRSGGADLEVTMTQDTLILDRSGHRISLSGIDIGDRVQTFGELISGTLSADTVINLSLDYSELSAPVGAGVPLQAALAVPQPTYTTNPANPISPIPTVVPEITAQAGAIEAQSTITQEQPRPLQVLGILMGHSGNALAVLIGGEMWTIHVDQTSIGFDKDGTRMSFARMRKGDTLQVAGTSKATLAMHASAIQNISVSFAQINAAAKKTQQKSKQKKNITATIQENRYTRTS